MNMQIDLRVAELLASRLCHDLVSPIGAVNNGMELLEDDPDPDMLGDAVRLAGGSARQASATVQFYRMAYGRAGARMDANPDEMRRLSDAYVTPHKAQLVWSGEGLGDPAAPEGSGKLLLNMEALVLEALPRGGELTARAVAADGELTLEVVGRGQNAGLREEARTALADGVSVDDLTPRSVHAYFTRLQAERLGGTLAIETDDDGITARVRLALG